MNGVTPTSGRTPILSPPSPYGSIMYRVEYGPAPAGFGLSCRIGAETEMMAGASTRFGLGSVIEFAMDTASARSPVLNIGRAAALRRSVDRC